jgi:hypothetical protein
LTSAVGSGVSLVPAFDGAAFWAPVGLGIAAASVVGNELYQGLTRTPSKRGGNKKTGAKAEGQQLKRPEIRRRNCTAFLVLPRPATECVRPRPQYGPLTSVPGIGQTLATVIFLETGLIERFAEVGNFASHALRRQRAHQQSQEER